MSATRNNLIFGITVAMVMVAGLAVPCSFVSAYTIETIPNPDEVFGDFVVGPGKVELEMNPGETKVVNLMVTNRMGDDRIFNLDIEDFVGSDNPESPVTLLGDARGPYSLRDYLSVSQKSFELKQGQRAVVPVTVFVPADAEPGGLYGSVLSSTVSKSASSGAPASNAIVARIGTLFFIRVKGPVHAEGALTEFTTARNQSAFDTAPIPFHLVYHNTGSVHVNPYGEIRVTNMFGKEVGAVDVSPWFAMPGTFRTREVEWNPGFLLGRYTATASINRGYNDIIDTRQVTFWVIPVKLVAVVIVGIAGLLLVLRYIVTRFEIKRK